MLDYSGRSDDKWMEREGVRETRHGMVSQQSSPLKEKKQKKGEKRITMNFRQRMFNKLS